MTTFFLDLWHDLREKRLWPVAVGLLAAIVAVPAILFKPASDAAPDTAVAPRTISGQTLPVVAVESGPTQGSKLEAFSAKNPFKPMKDLAKTSTPGDSGSGSADGSGAGDGGSFGGGSTGSDAAGDLGGGSGSGGATVGSDGSTPSAPGIPRVVEWFRYAADFSFGPSGDTKKFKGPASFTTLPDENSPSIVFLGVSDDGKSALFLISDPAFEAEGEGKCTPKGGPCQFVALKVSDTNDEETFTSVDGSVSYELKLDRIRREKLETDGNGDPVPSKSKTIAGADAEAGEASAEAVPELFASGPGFAREKR
jgi:hypothetical protein